MLRGKVSRIPHPRLSLINNLINSPLVRWDKVKNGLSRKRRNIGCRGEILDCSLVDLHDGKRVSRLGNDSFHPC